MKGICLVIISLLLSSQIAQASKFVGIWELASVGGKETSEKGPKLSLFVNKGGEAFLANEQEIKMGTWSVNDEQKMFTLKFAQHTEEWKIVKVKGAEWKVEIKGEKATWQKHSKLKPRSRNRYWRRLWGQWRVEEVSGQKQEDLTIGFKVGSVLVMNEKGFEKVVQWQLSECGYFVILDDGKKIEPTELQLLEKGQMRLKIDGAEATFRREYPRLKLKSLKLQTAERRLLGSWQAANPENEGETMEMTFSHEGYVSTLLGEGRKLIERWKLEEDAETLTIYTNENRYEVKVKFIDRRRIELVEEGQPISLKRVKKRVKK